MLCSQVEVVSIAKLFAKRVLQKALGFHRYLVLHSLFVAVTLRLRRGEGAILRFIEQLAPNATVLDVGANVGTMTLLFARHCSRGRVFAFEPIPENLAATRTIVRLFGLHNVAVYPCGLGERDETVTMIMPSEQGVRLEGLSHVAEAASAEHGTRYDIDLRRLDGMAPFDDVRVDAIKLDVEDHERFVLMGAEQIIARDRPLIYAELWSSENRTACFALLARHGYRAFGVDRRRAFVPFDQFSTPPENVFFVPSTPP